MTNLQAEKLKKLIETIQRNPELLDKLSIDRKKAERFFLDATSTGQSKISVQQKIS